VESLLVSPAYYRIRWLDLSSLLAYLCWTSAFTAEASSFKRRLREWTLWDCSSEEPPFEWAGCHHRTPLACRASSNCNHVQPSVTTRPNDRVAVNFGQIETEYGSAITTQVNRTTPVTPALFSMPGKVIAELSGPAQQGRSTTREELSISVMTLIGH